LGCGEEAMQQVLEGAGTTAWRVQDSENAMSLADKAKNKSKNFRARAKKPRVERPATTTQS
jgi:hypothetical protein